MIHETNPNPPPAAVLRALPALDPRALEARPDRVVIDLRSPAEFAEDHVDGAWNLPLFDDDERALVGTLYRRVSPAAAFERGRELVEARIEDLVLAIAERAGWTPPRADLRARVRELTARGYEGFAGELDVRPVAADEAELLRSPVALCCWRGGMRSRSVTLLLRELGLARAGLIAGGYRAWRRLVVEDLARFDAPPTYVLRGLTGVGKTLVLRELERLRPRWTLDLEGCAQHRSSILGMVGLEPVSQKAFEARVRARLALGFDGVLVVEGESRKVGDVVVPQRVWSALDGGTSVELVASIERRVEVLEHDYLARPENAAELLPRLEYLDDRIGHAPGESTLVARFEGGDVDGVVRELLERWYDPRYRHGEQGRAHAATFDATDPTRCARELVAWIETQPTARRVVPRKGVHA
ncbi:MAG: tRNA 2-selenouridine(34) synthase MnmH [Planctomycetes bacterium]|nr:tRNA 2-selenouridine(34) synthase MnmH [Planctomycetota bacterium]